jgi:putative MATE family efflux protein
VQRRVFNLAWPVIGENFLQTMLGIVDTFIVAKLGAEAIAGVGAALQFMFFVIATLSAVSVGSSVLVAQAVGGRRLAQANVLAKQSLVWSVIISIPLALLGLFAADRLILIFGMEPAVNEIGAAYLRVTMGTVVVLSLQLLGSGVLRGAGNSRTPMLVTAAANVVNIVLAYALVFGHFGLPALGAVGSAWATFLARTFGLGLLLFALWRGSNGVTIRGRVDWRPAFNTARGILRIGVPAALEQLLTSTAFLFLTIVVAHMGTLALAAHRIAFNALSLSFLPGFGFALAATALVGQSIGARQPQDGRAVARIATTWAVVWMAAMGVVFFLFGEPIMRLFSDDPTVIALGAAGLRALALTQPFWAILFVQAGALRGTGDTRFPFFANTVSIWCAVLLAWGLVQMAATASLALVWSAFLVVAPINAALLLWRFRRTIGDKIRGQASAR